MPSGSEGKDRILTHTLCVSVCVSIQLLLEHQEVLCHDSSDPLRLLLKELGPAPSLQDLIGTSAGVPPPITVQGGSALWGQWVAAVVVHSLTTGGQQRATDLQNLISWIPSIITGGANKR